MMTSADKVGGWVKKGQNHDDVILEWSLSRKLISSDSVFTIRIISNYHNCCCDCNIYREIRNIYFTRTKCYIATNCHASGYNHSVQATELEVNALVMF
jgi:hypothetical protein